jgi:hypothetical protein
MLSKPRKLMTTVGKNLFSAQQFRKIPKKSEKILKKPLMLSKP